MSKLDDILIYAAEHDEMLYYSGSIANIDLKKEIKDLMLEIIGDNQNIAEERSEYKPDYVIESQNLLRSELHQKVQKL